MIRKYKKEDKDAVLQLLKMNIPDYFAASEYDDLINYLESGYEDYFVVNIDGIVVGAGGINYFLKNKTARLSWDIIHPDWQGKGIGSRLTKMRIELINANPDIDLIEVRTSQLAYRFYEKMGFKLEYTSDDFWAKGYHMYCMRMSINH